MSASPAISFPDLRREWCDPTTVFVLLFGLFAWTAPRTVAFEDDGGFIMAAEFLGIAHPPGYPLYVLLAKLSTFVPVGSAAYRVHIFSGLLGATTCCVMWWIVRSLTRDRAIAGISALAYGLSPVMWTQSIIAEVYTLNALLFFGIFALALVVLKTGRADVFPLMSLLFGLTLCNHLPLSLLAAPSLALILWPMRRALIMRLPVALVAFTVGLLPYTWMVFRSLQNPEFSFYGPIRNWDELLYYVSRSGYTALDNNPEANLEDKLSFVKFLLVEAVWQYTPVGALVVIAGAISQLRSTRAGWGLGLLIGFLGGGFVVVAFVTLDFQFVQKMIFRVYPLIPYGFMAIWLGFGLTWSSERLSQRMPGERGRQLVLFFGTGLLFAMGLLGMRTGDRHAQTFARDYAEGILESLEPDAIFFIDTDADVFPMGYLNLVEGVRPDVSLYHYEGLILPTRLIHARDGTVVARNRSVRRLLAETERPVYFTLARDVGHGFEDLGLYKRLIRDRPFSTQMEARVDPQLLALVVKLSQEEDLSDPWTRLQLDATLANYTRMLARFVNESPNDPRIAEYRARLDEITTRFLPAYARLVADIAARAQDPAELLEAATRLESLLDDTISNPNRAAFHTTHGFLLVANQREDEALQAFETSWRAFPNEGNAAFMALLRLYAQRSDREAYHRLRGSLRLSRGSPELVKLDREMGF